MLLHQVVLCSYQHWSTKCVQICVMLLVWHAVDFVRSIHMDVSDLYKTEK